MGRIVELDDAPDNIRIAAETVLPEPVADQAPQAAIRAGHRPRERAAEPGRRAAPGKIRVTRPAL